jgi:hypothetical protein
MKLRETHLRPRLEHVEWPASTKCVATGIWTKRIVFEVKRDSIVYVCVHALQENARNARYCHEYTHQPHQKIEKNRHSQALSGEARTVSDWVKYALDKRPAKIHESGDWVKYAIYKRSSNRYVKAVNLPQWETAWSMRERRWRHCWVFGCNARVKLNFW